MFPPALEAPSPARPVFPAERIGAALEVIMCSGFPTQLLLVVVLGGFGMTMHGEDGRLNADFVFLVSMLDAVLVVGLVVLLLRAHRESVKDVLIGRGRVFQEVLVGLALIPLVFVVVVVILGIVLVYAPELHNVARNPLEEMLRTRRDVVIFTIVAIVAGGVREEVQRGFIVHRFGQYLGGGTLGVLVYSVFFGLGHFEQGRDVALATTVLGAMWGLIYLRRRSIVAPVISHAGFNLAQVIKQVALR